MNRQNLDDPERGSNRFFLLFALMFTLLFPLVIGGLLESVKAGIVTAVISIFAFLLFFAVLKNLSRTAGYSLFGLGQKVDEQELDRASLYDRARAAHRNGQHLEAVALYKEFLNSDLDPAPVRSAFFIAQIYEQDLNRFNDAMHWYLKTISIATATEDGETKLASFIRESREGIERIRSILADQGPVIEKLIEAKEEIEAGRIEEAKAILERLEQVHPDNAEVDYLLGHMYLNIDNHDMALKHFKRTVEKDPHHILAAFFIANSLDALGHCPEAKQAYLNYIAAAENDPIENERVAQARERLEIIDGDLHSDPALFHPPKQVIGS